MIITFARSSSIANFKFCEMQYFLTYNLGLLRPSSKKADQGSAVHKVLEWLASGKQYLQNNPDAKNVLMDGCNLEFKREEFLEQYKLTDDEVAQVNKERINKAIYKSDASIKSGHTRRGSKMVKALVEESCKYYSTKSSEAWTKASYRDVENWTWIALDYRGGIYDPRLRTIKNPEQHFDLLIDADWAHYDFIGPDNQRLQGQYGIKGTVDLITELDSDTIEVVDWKTGQRLDWATGEVKTYDKLCNDVQLMLYYYALTKVYPQYKNILITIFFIRDGGPFTVCFEPHQLSMVEDKLREHFEGVSACDIPEMCSKDQSDFKCTRICNYYKEQLPGTNCNTCKHIQNEIKKNGINDTISKYKRPDFEFGHYEAPGE